jgi:tetratricopeptide (TPR) repeat protein
MNTTNKIDTYRVAGGSGSHLLILIFLVLLAYSNTFHASWHLDDITNILDNKNVHVSTLSFSDWAKSIRAPFTDLSNPRPGLSGLYRPVAMLTFGLNWYLGGTHVFGYHLVNIGIHCLTSGLLFFTILNLMRTPNMINRYQGNEHFIALLATALWALHPIQTQAVTYIVQRMASLAALFYLSAIFLFVKGRNAKTPVSRGCFWGGCLLCFLLAVGSKQNAITLPAALLLIEIIFYIKPGFWRQDKAKWIVVGSVVGLAILSVLLFFYWQKNPMSALIAGYEKRPFTMIERLLTETRVSLFYLYQLLYPVPGQFSILHDFSLSTSLLTPWTTPVAIATILMLLLFAGYNIRRKPLLSFAICFFFLGHSIESTIFPLELVFEHRNYLPSLFLFLPIASGMACLVDKFRDKSTIVYRMLVGIVPVLVVALGLGCHTRNMAWATEKTLWQDAMQKAPALARPYQNIAMALEREQNLETALKLYRKALDLRDPEPKLSRFISYANMGNIYKKKKEYQKAVQFLTAATRVETGPYIDRVRYNLVLCLLNTHQEAEALKHLEFLLSGQKNNSRFLTTRGFILFQQGDIDLALQHYRAALQQKPHNMDLLLNMGMALSTDGYHERAETFLKKALDQYPDNLVIHLVLLQHSLKIQDEIRINQYLAQITKRFKLSDIEQYLADRARGWHFVNDTLVPVDDAMVIPTLVRYLKLKAENIDKKQGAAKT